MTVAHRLIIFFEGLFSFLDFSLDESIANLDFESINGGAILQGKTVSGFNGMFFIVLKSLDYGYARSDICNLDRYIYALKWHTAALDEQAGLSNSI